MTKINIVYKKQEIEIMRFFLGDDYEIISEVEGKCYVLTVGGKYGYNECFTHLDNEFFEKQRYDEIAPNRMFKVYGFFIMDSREEPNVWFRGEQNSNGNYEFDCCADSLQDIIEIL